MSFGTWRNTEWEERTDEEKDWVCISWRQTTVYLRCKCKNSSCGHPRFSHPCAAGQTNNTRATSGSLFKQHTGALPHRVKKLRLGIRRFSAAKDLITLFSLIENGMLFHLIELAWHGVIYGFQKCFCSLSKAFQMIIFSHWSFWCNFFFHW